MLVGAAVFLLSSPVLADGQDYHESVSSSGPPRWLTVVLESGHAAAWVDHPKRPVYRWTGELLPGYEWDWLALQAALQLNYRNPGWDGGFGGRVTLLLARAAGGFVPLRVFGEATYLPVGQGVYFAGGPMAGIGRLAHVGLIGGYDTDRKAAFFGVRLGIELTAFSDPVRAITHFAPYQPLPAREH